MPRSFVPLPTWRPGRGRALAFMAALGLAGAGLQAWAQTLPYPRLTSVFPPGAAAGSTSIVQVAGIDLDDPAALLCSDPRITGRPSGTNPAVFVVTVPDSVPPGGVDLRWAGRFGVSNPRGFSISAGPEILSPGNHARPTVAMDLPLQTVVNGRVNAQEIAWFRVAGVAGRHCMIRVVTRELDSRLEPILKVASNDGRPLDQSRRGWIDFVPATDGPFLVGVHDATYRGGGDFVFRLSATLDPHLDFALPVVLRAGETNRVTLFGRNLPDGLPSEVRGADGRPLQQVTVEVFAPLPGSGTDASLAVLRRPAAAAVAADTMAWRWNAPESGSQELIFGRSELPGVTASTAGWVEVTPPVDFSGMFPSRPGLGGARFQARKDDVWWVEVAADRLGYPCDAAAVIQRERRPAGDSGAVVFEDVLELPELDANLGGLDANTSSRDCAGRFVVPEDGVYRVMIRDLFHSGAGSPQFPYRLSVRRPTPDFGLVTVLPQPPRQNDNDRAVHPVTPNLRAGETRAIRVMALRRDGFDGEIALSVTGLPEGVSATAVGIPAGQNVGHVLVTASDVLPAGADMGLVQIVGRAAGTATNTPSVDRRAAWTVVSRPVSDSNEQAVVPRFAREPVLGLCRAEPAPVSVWATNAELQAVLNGKLVIPVEAVRRGEFPGAISLKPMGRAEWDPVKPAVLPEKATQAVLEFDLAGSKLPEGVHTLWLQGTVAGKYRDRPEALAAAEAELKAAEDALKSATESEKAPLEQRRQQAEAKRKAAEERAKPRDVNFVVASRPLTVRLLPAPPAPKP